MPVVRPHERSGDAREPPAGERVPLGTGPRSHRRDPWGEASFALDVRSEELWAAHVHVVLGDETLSLELDGDLEAREMEGEPQPTVDDAGGPDGGGRTRVTGRGSGV